jgi:hypothetical protein
VKRSEKQERKKKTHGSILDKYTCFFSKSRGSEADFHHVLLKIEYVLVVGA